VLRNPHLLFLYSISQNMKEKNLKVSKAAERKEERER